MAEPDSASRGIAIARLEPIGQEAEETFSQLVESKGLSKYHNQFIVATRCDPVTSSSESLSETGDESDRLPHPRRKKTPDKLWSGHYLLSSNLPGHIQATIGWRVGRGHFKFQNRGVDLLVVPSGTSSRKVAVVHALIQFHPNSGILMIRGVSETQPVEYYVDNKPLLLYAGDGHVLYQAVNRFRLGKLEYNFVYEKLNDDQYNDYVGIRNEALEEALEEAGEGIPNSRILAIPRRPHVKYFNTILHENISCGAFGLVCAAVDARSGAPIAMKEIWIKHKNMLQDNGLKAERKISTDFRGAEGLLQAHTVQCQHGLPTPCGKIPERFFMTFPLALHDFSVHNWSTTSLPTMLALITGPLKGLKTLHKAGYMHRDVSAKNILVMSLVPPRAVLCDYGKARRAPWHVDSHIGPIAFLPPEVDGQRRYDSKIDVWGIGYVCCEILFPGYQSDFRSKTKNSRPDETWHKGAMALLLEYGNRGSAERSFADLIRRMLAWNPAHRLSAAEALQHDCMPPDHTSPEPSGAPGAKSHKTSHSSSSAAINRAKLDEEDHSGDTEILTSGRRPSSFEESAQEIKAATMLAKANAQAEKQAERS